MQTPSQHHHPAGSPSVVTITATKAATAARWRQRFGRALLAAASLYALPAGAESVYILTTDNKIATAPLGFLPAVNAGVTITGINVSETLVAIDVRPQTQRLYGLGVNATTDTATLYHIAPETGVAAVVGTAGAIAFTTDGVTPVDFPDPATVGWDIDFNPAVDRLRVVAGSLNFRVNPNNGTAVDGNNGTMSATGTNPDGAINGGTTTVNGTAYVNSQPNNGNVTTQYTLDAATNSLYIQNPPNNGTQTLGQPVTFGPSPLDFSGQVGFDIPPGVNATASNMPVTTGLGYALLTVGGTTGLYVINLVNGQAALIGAINGRSIAIRTELGAAIAMSADSANLIRFNTSTPNTTTTQALGAPAAGETLVGIDFRPQTGQYYALGVDAAANTASLYLVDPQTGAVTLAVAGTGSLITFAGVDFPDPATSGYGIDFNPTVDRLRVVTSTGLNFRVNPITGLPAAATQDGNISGSGSAGVDATAYTNSFGQSLTGGVTTQYTLNSASDTLFIQNPPNNGTQTLPQPVTLGGNALDFTTANGFDIPAPVAVTVSNTVAKGEGWLAANVGGVAGLYRLDLSTGVAVSVGSVGAGTTPLAGLTVNATAAIGVESPTSTVIFNNTAEIDFGNVVVNQSATRTVTIRNTGSQALTYTTDIDIGTTFSATFNGSGTVAPGGSVDVEITYTPDDALASNIDLLQILNNDAAVPIFSIDLIGAGFVPVADDAIAVTGGDTRLYVLANDGLTNNAVITEVSDSSIVIDGRTLIIPSGYTGTFTYTVVDLGVTYMASVTVTAGTPVVNPTVFNGLLYNDDDRLVGFASVKISTSGVATVKLSASTAKVTAKITFPTGSSTGTAFTSLGNLVLTKNLDGTADIFLTALGGNIVGQLNAVVPTATAAKLHLAFGSIDPMFPGAGFAIATTSTKGTIKITGTLPDGIAFSGSTGLRDNGTFAFYSAVTKGPKPPAFIGGELVTANLTATDVTGELAWSKLPQLPGAKGVYLGGVDTTLTATGSLYAGAPLFAGAGTLILSGGNLAMTETNAVTVTAGVPTVAGSLTAWTGVKAKDGKFKAKVTVPGITKDVKGSGLYLPKSNSAVGFFPGTSVGGRIQLTVP